jgi:hypothetical protein
LARKSSSAIERSSGKVLDNEKDIEFAAKLAREIKGLPMKRDLIAQKIHPLRGTPSLNFQL